MTARCPCQHCGADLEFDTADLAGAETATAECPSCHSETVVCVPENKNSIKGTQTVAPLPPLVADLIVKGTILDYSVQSNSGFISGDDTKDYFFEGTDWRTQDAFPTPGKRVEFVRKGDRAAAIYMLGRQLVPKKRKFSVAGVIGLSFAGLLFLAIVIPNIARMLDRPTDVKKDAAGAGKSVAFQVRLGTLQITTIDELAHNTAMNIFPDNEAKRAKWENDFKRGYNAQIGELQGPYGDGFINGWKAAKGGTIKPTSDELSAAARQSYENEAANLYETGFDAGWSLAGGN